MASGMISTLLFGWISNNWGRYISLLLNFVISAIGCIGIGFSTNYTMVLIFYIANGTAYPFLTNSSMYL
jgi:MFS family permease